MSLVGTKRTSRIFGPMSASLIGRSGSSTFRLSAAAVLMSHAGSRFSSDSAPGPFHYGIRRRGGTIFCAALPSSDGRSKHSLCRRCHCYRSDNSLRAVAIAWGSLASFGAVRRSVACPRSYGSAEGFLFVSAKHVADAGSDGECAQCFMRGQCFTDP